MFARQCFFPGCRSYRRDQRLTCGEHTDDEAVLIKVIGAGPIANQADAYARMKVRRWSSQQKK